MLFNRLKYSESHIPDGGLRESPTSPHLPGKKNTSILNDLPRATISFVSKFYGKPEFLQAIQVRGPQLRLWYV